MAETDKPFEDAMEANEMQVEEEEGGYEEEYDEEEDQEDELYDEDDDANQEAEEMAKRLGDALWADISKAFAATSAQGRSGVESHVVHSGERDDDETLVNAVQEVIDLTELHSDLFQKLSEAVIPGSEDSLFDALTEIVQSKQVSVEQANVVSDLVQSILDGDLFQ